jgi:hypothetical protein
MYMGKAFITIYKLCFISSFRCVLAARAPHQQVGRHLFWRRAPHQQLAAPARTRKKGVSDKLHATDVTNYTQQIVPNIHARRTQGPYAATHARGSCRFSYRQKGRIKKDTDKIRVECKSYRAHYWAPSYHTKGMLVLWLRPVLFGSLFTSPLADEKHRNQPMRAAPEAM